VSSRDRPHTVRRAGSLSPWDTTSSATMGETRSRGGQPCSEDVGHAGGTTFVLRQAVDRTAGSSGCALPGMSAGLRAIAPSGAARMGLKASANMEAGYRSPHARQ
jgi:hypothetical protein